MTTIYTYSEARQNLASLLDEAAVEGEVLLKRRDGRMFAIRPVAVQGSPLDVEGIDVDLTAGEIVAFIAESRRYAGPQQDE
jgi:hypothetical protein